MLNLLNLDYGHSGVAGVGSAECWGTSCLGSAASITIWTSGAYSQHNNISFFGHSSGAWVELGQWQPTEMSDDDN